MKPITRAQRRAIKAIYDRYPIFVGGKTAQQIVYDAGWRYVAVTDLPFGDLRNKANDLGYSHVWVHGVYYPVYLDCTKIVEDYGLDTRITYRDFRKTVKQGFDCLMVRWCGMMLGIESDGYVHS